MPQPKKAEAWEEKDFGNGWSIEQEWKLHNGETKVPAWFRDFVHRAIRSTLEAERARVVGMLEGMKVPEIHTSDCEYQRKGCGCGYEERYTNNYVLSHAIKSIETKE